MWGCELSNLVESNHWKGEGTTEKGLTCNMQVQNENQKLISI